MPQFGVQSGARNSHLVSEAADELKPILGAATKLRMVRSDVPVGCYLSGGLDSTIIAALARQATEAEFRTFSLRFADESHDEGRYQKVVASLLGSRHDEITVSDDDIAVALPDVIKYAECPILRSAPAPMLLLSRHVHEEGFKAVLTGEGADEFLAGYDIFLEAKVREFWARDPNSETRPLLLERLYPYLAKSPRAAGRMGREFWRRGLSDPGKVSYSHWPRWSTTAGLKRFFSRDLLDTLERSPSSLIEDELPDNLGVGDILDRAQTLEIVSFLSSYLLSSQADRMMMANSVEGRFPFLDIGVMDFSLRLPHSVRLPGLNAKAVLRRSAQDLIPEQILNREKFPYRAPDIGSAIFRTSGSGVRDLLHRNHLTEAGYFDPEHVSGFMRKMASRTQDPRFSLGNSDSMILMGILSTQLLHELFVKSWKPEASPHPGKFQILCDRGKD